MGKREGKVAAITGAHHKWSTRGFAGSCPHAYRNHTFVNEEANSLTSTTSLEGTLLISTTSQFDKGRVLS